MRHEKTGVTQALIESAKKEFLTFGFNDSSLRRISANSGVSTNSIYTRFKDKAGLFEAVVSEAADGLMELYLAYIRPAREALDMEVAIAQGNQGCDEVLAYIFRYKEEFILLFCHSQGTKFQDYFDQLSKIEEEFYRFFVKKYGKKGEDIEAFFIHVQCRLGWQCIYEILSHDKSYEEALVFMENVRKFNFAGWKSLMGLK